MGSLSTPWGLGTRFVPESLMCSCPVLVLITCSDSLQSSRWHPPEKLRRLPGYSAQVCWHSLTMQPPLPSGTNVVRDESKMYVRFVRWIVVMCDVMWCGVVWCDVMWCDVMWCGVVWYGMVWYGMVWYGMVWCGVVWCGVVWCGVVWCDVMWCGVVWCGMVWCGVVWCGVGCVVWYGVVLM